MNELLGYLDNFDPQLHRAQYALNGDWEHAVNIDLDESDAPLINTPDASIAIEIFYELNDQREVFMGIRYADKLALAESPAQFLSNTLRVLSQAKDQNPRALSELLGSALNNDPDTYTAQPVQYAELGVEGHWKSEGSAILRKAGAPPLSSASLETLLQQHPQLLKNSKNIVALEFAVTAPSAWIGVQVSTLKDGAFVTNAESLLALVNLI